MADDIFEARRKRGVLSYEDPILLNEAKRRMQQTIGELEDEGIGVRTDYSKTGPLTSTTRGGKHKPSIGDWRASTSYRPRPGTGGVIYDVGNQQVNVPQTPSLANWFTLNEEASHARKRKDLGSQHKKNLGQEWSVKDLAEEYRAKQEAKDMLGGYLTPDVQDFVDYTHESYDRHHENQMKKQARAKAAAAAAKKEAGGK